MVLASLGTDVMDGDGPSQANSAQMSLPKAIRAARETLGWSQHDLAKRLGLSKAAVGHWETGTYTPDIATRIELSELLGIRFSDLLPEAKGPVAVVRDRDLVSIVSLLEQVPPARRASLLRIIAAAAEEYLTTPEASEQRGKQAG